MLRSLQRSLQGRYRSLQVTTGHYRSLRVTTGSLRGHYRSLQVTTGHYGSLQGHYGVTTGHYRSLRVTTGHYGSLRVTTRSLRVTTGHYGVTTGSLRLRQGIYSQSLQSSISAQRKKLTAARHGTALKRNEHYRRYIAKNLDYPEQILEPAGLKTESKLKTASIFGPGQGFSGRA